MNALITRPGVPHSPVSSICNGAKGRRKVAVGEIGIPTREA